MLDCWSSSEYLDDDDYDDDNNDGFIWNLLERPEAQMLCFTMNSRLVFKIIEKALVLGARQGASAEIELRWTPPTRASHCTGVERERLW